MPDPPPTGAYISTHNYFRYSLETPKQRFERLQVEKRERTEKSRELMSAISTPHHEALLIERRAPQAAFRRQMSEAHPNFFLQQLKESALRTEGAEPTKPRKQALNVSAQLQQRHQPKPAQTKLLIHQQLTHLKLARERNLQKVLERSLTPLTSGLMSAITSGVSSGFVTAFHSRTASQGQQQQQYTTGSHLNPVSESSALQTPQQITRNNSQTSIRLEGKPSAVTFQRPGSATKEVAPAQSASGLPAPRSVKPRASQFRTHHQIPSALGGANAQGSSSALQFAKSSRVIR